MAQRDKRVGPHEAKQYAFGRYLRSQGEQGFKGEVGSAGGLGRVGHRNYEAGFTGDGEAGHGEAVFKAGGRSMGLERLRADRGEENGIEIECCAGRARNRQMAKMGRIKTAAEEGHARAARWGLLLHVFIVPCKGVVNAGPAYGPCAKRSGSIRFTRMRYLIALLALAGVVVSILALRVHYDTGTEPCSINEKWDCGIVNHSPFAVIAGVPVAAIGIAGYAALAVLALARRRRLLAVAAMAGLGFALYLTHIEKSILQVWCLYCVISQGVIALVTLLSLGWLAAEKFKKRHAQKHA